MAEISYNPDVEQIIRGNLAATKEWGWEEDERKWSAVGAALKYFHDHTTMSEMLALGLAEKITTEIMSEESERKHMDKQFDQAAALSDYTELKRRISVGAYEERKSEHFETGTYPEDGIEESIDNLTELAARHGLEFIWDMGTKTWSLLPMSEETRAARQASQSYQPPEKDSDAPWTGDFDTMHS